MMVDEHSTMAGVCGIEPYELVVERRPNDGLRKGVVCPKNSWCIEV